VDELLTYHYLVAELFTMIPPSEMTPEKFWKLSKTAQADLIWEWVFIKGGALSEAARGVLTTLSHLGLDVAGRDLKAIRKWFAAQKADDYLELVFQTANIDYAVMTNNPFVVEEAKHWKARKATGKRLKTALRIDPLLVSWPAAVAAMNKAGYKVKDEPDEASLAQCRKFLSDWVKRIKPMYMAASLSNYFRYPTDELDTTMLDEVIVPVAQKARIPLALMIGVRKQVRPALGDGGDAVGVADVEAVQNLCINHPDAKFVCTMLSRVNQHELTVLARKFGNLHIEGCWWFLNDPSMIDELTRMRIELLGTAFTAQHSDARVLDQLVYKWSHTRTILADVLSDKYRDLFATGWRPTEDEIKRDVRNLLGGSFQAFLNKT
jgi:hypothetical protein